MDKSAPANRNVLQTLGQLGIPVFPLPRESKLPRLERFWEHASVDPTFTLDSNNAAAATGNGYIVLDFDVRPDTGVDARPTLDSWDMMGLPHSLRVRTPRGGVHVYLATGERPIANSAGKLAKGVDVRGHHGYVVAPGSSTSAGSYEIIGEVPDQLAPLPDWLAEKCDAPRERDAEAEIPATELDTEASIAAATDYLVRNAPEAVEGSGGNPTTYAVAARVRDFGISEPMAFDLMAEHYNETKAIPAWHPDELAGIVANAYGYAQNRAGAKAPQAEFDQAIPREYLEHIEATRERYMGATAPANDDRPILGVEQDKPMPAPFKAWQAIDLAAIPYPEFVYSDFYARGYTSVTTAAPKVGKSGLALAEAIDMATGRGFLSGQPRAPLRVVYYNAEDDQDVLNSRVSAVLEQFDIDQSEIVGQLYATSGVNGNWHLIRGQEGEIVEAAFKGLEQFIAEERADVLVLDPLQDLSRSPETNEVFRALGQRLRRLASATHVAVGLIHHTRKGTAGVETSVDDMRGGSALRGTARFNRVLAAMTAKEAAEAGVDDHRNFFRIGDSESNLAPPSSDWNRWFRKVNVRTPSGRGIVATVPWNWPDAFEGIDENAATRVRAEVARRESQGDPPKENVQSNDWVGHLIAEVLDIDDPKGAGRERVRKILGTWLAAGYLARGEMRDTKKSRNMPCIVKGPNEPDSAESEFGGVE